MLYTPNTNQNQIIAKLIELQLRKPVNSKAKLKKPQKATKQVESQCYVLGYN